MAEKVVVTRTMADDLDGTEWNPDDEGAGRAVEFEYGGQRYSIDLAAGNADEFDKMMRRYVEAARRLGNSRPARVTGSRGGAGHRARGGGQGMGRSKEEIAAMRAWLREHGHTVADSGLVPKALQEIYDKRESEPMIPNTEASAKARTPGKAPGRPAPSTAEFTEPAKVSPLDALIPPRVSAPVGRGSDNR